jgi:hypothetical protein
MKRIFKTRYFARWMRKTDLTDTALLNAVDEMIQGLIDADLGGSILKKRVGIADRGKRGGARTLVSTNQKNRWFFLFGFEKNDRSNVTSNELEGLKELAQDWLSRSEIELEIAVKENILEEVLHEQKTKNQK